MIANYHTHTPRCNHAVGTEEAYIRAALSRGLSILGFSDHTPYVFPGGYYSSFRMKMSQMEGYVRSVLEMRGKYADRIQIHLGLETEYYPAFFPELMEILKDYPLEYMLLGQHFVGNEMGEHYSGAPTADVSILERYCDQVIDAMQTGRFTYLAHPDLINFRGDRRILARNLRRVCREAKSCGLPLEINLLGLEQRRNYPCRTYLEQAAEEGCSMILGCDSHDPKALADRGSEKQARAMAAEYGLTILDTVDFRPVR